MKNRSLLAAVLLTLAAPSFACSDLRSTDFNPGSAELTLNTIELLDQAIDIARKYPGIHVEVAGHTDNCPGQDHMALSQRRADAVAVYLRKNGFPENQIIAVKGYGDTRPLLNTPKDFPACRNRTNNRVELNVAN